MNARSTQSEIDPFIEKFQGLTSETLGIEGYAGLYCDHLLASLTYYSEIYHHIIGLALKGIDKPVRQLSVLDYGAGNGFLAMFAKYSGFGKVWMCDTSQPFLDAARKTSSFLHIDIDDFILGDIDAVNTFFKGKEVKPDIVLSTDVIEHIYDLNSFFDQLALLNASLSCVFTTASNPYNHYKVKQLNKQQYLDEWVGHSRLSETERNKNGLSKFSFYEQRRKIIAASFPSLSESQLDRLAKFTRGSRKDDVIRSVEIFVQKGKKILAPEDPNWVCDPETGSWTERILPISMYERLFKDHGFSFSMYNGFYNNYSEKRIKALIAKFLNRQITKHQRLGRYIAPFVILSGTKGIQTIG